MNSFKINSFKINFIAKKPGSGMGMKLGSGLGMRLSYGMGTRPIIFLLSIPSCNQQLRKNEIVYTHSAAGSVVL